MRKEDWLYVTVRCSPQAADAVHVVLLERSGNRGTVEQTSGDALVVGAYIPLDENWSTRVGEIADCLAALRALFPDAVIAGPAATIVADKEWSEAWKQEHKIQRVGRLVVKPTWATMPPLEPGWVIIDLDPGMAFGTGGHSSTRLALEALQAALRPGHVLADVGTGTGILAVAAALLGASRVYAVDSDPLAVRSARANCRRNSVEAVVEVQCADFLTEVPGDLDGIIANISPHADATLASVAARYLKSEGYLILSGFTSQAEPELLETLSDAGFEVQQRFAESEWVCLSCALGRAL